MVKVRFFLGLELVLGLGLVRVSVLIPVPEYWSMPRVLATLIYGRTRTDCNMCIVTQCSMSPAASF